MLVYDDGIIKIMRVILVKIVKNQRKSSYESDNQVNG